MKDTAKNTGLTSLLSSPEWLVDETQFNVNKLNAFETIFTIGNGYLGTRGSLEEGHAAGLPGTYINGIFDHYDSFIVDLVNAPDWSNISVWIEGEKLNLHTCKILNYHRILDLKQGFLYRFTKFQDRKGRITEYESIRYASFAEKHFFEVKISLKPENYSGKIKVEAPINGRVFNLDLEPAYKEIPQFTPEAKWNKWTKSKHLIQSNSGELVQGIFLEMKTLDRPHHIFYGSLLKVKDVNASITNNFDYEFASQTAEFKVAEGNIYEIEKLVSIFTTRDVDTSKLKTEVQKILKENFEQSFKSRFEKHKKVWEQKWNDCNITIEGDPKANNALKFNIYHLLITANENDYKANIGAKSLSGEGYKGHVFWDTEIFLLPFYIYTQPETAKALMMYRYNTLDGARDYAKEGGFKGARFAWESADTGHEATPPWTADGKIRIWTGEREIHITSAVVYGAISYYNATGDIDFMTNYGLEILFETARFWNSRLEYNKLKDRYEITGIEGPDEFHELVNNSVYTNWLTKWNLEQSVNFYNNFKKTHPQVIKEYSESLKIKEKEVDEWKQKASKIYIPFDPDKKLVEQFEGYFKLKNEIITQWDENNMPKHPIAEDHIERSKTTLIKQPDVLMLMLMMPDAFSDEIKKLNYEYYEARTMHKSSLSPSIHTILGIETDHHEKALQYFERSAYVDLINNQGNTGWGMHIASAGGTWQAIVNGFAGMRVKHGQLTFKPWLPPAWKKISFKIKWQGDIIDIVIDHQNIKIERHIKANGNLDIFVKEELINLEPGKLKTITYN